MAHIHLEDGSFPLPWVALWWVVTLVIIALTLYSIRRGGKPGGRMITVAAFCTAAAFVVSQISIPVLGGVHLSVTPLIGILTGPAVGSLVVLLVNILSAAIGHGGWGLIGANTLISLIEVITAYLAFRGTRTLIHRAFARAGIAAFASLTAGNLALIAIILVSGIQGVTQGTLQVLYGLSVLAVINIGAAVIEAIVTGFVIGYLDKVRPDLLGKGRT